MNAILQSVFPCAFTKEKHEKAMQKYIPKIVALHSSGNVALQSGRYITGTRLANRHKQAQKVLKHA